MYYYSLKTPNGIEYAKNKIAFRSKKMATYELNRQVDRFAPISPLEYYYRILKKKLDKTFKV